MILEEKRTLAYSLVLVHVPDETDDVDEIHKRLVALSPLGQPVKLTDGRTVGRVVGLMQWPFAFQLKKRAYPARSCLVAVQWLSPQMMELAREAEVAIARDGVYLIGDESEPTQKAATRGWGPTARARPGGQRQVPLAGLGVPTGETPNLTA